MLGLLRITAPPHSLLCGPLNNQGVLACASGIRE